MVDRGTGDVWALLSDPEGERIRLVSPPPPGFRGHVYEAFSGPTLSAGGIRRLDCSFETGAGVRGLRP